MTDSSSSRSPAPAPAAPDPPDVPPASLAKDESSAPSHASHLLTSKRDTSSLQSPRALPYSRNQAQSAGVASGPQPLGVSRSSSIAASPRSSRESSPAGPSFRQLSSSAASTANTSRGMRSRKNSHDVSPQRSGNTTSTVPSAAAIQRALSSTAAPQLQPTTSAEQPSRLPRSQKSNGTAEGSRDGVLFPSSPRLKSPPPAASNPRRNSLRNPRKPESNGAAPNTVAQSTTMEQSPERFQKETENATLKSNSGPRVASNAPALETVQETSTPVTPQGDQNSLQRYGPMAERLLEL
jgi:hypothetical protein